MVLADYRFQVLVNVDYKIDEAFYYFQCCCFFAKNRNFVWYFCLGGGSGNIKK